MDHYLEIRLLPDPELKSTVLMSALFAKLHRALVELESTSIGVSFPGADPQRPGLGDLLRLHGRSDDLQRLIDLQWLIGMRDHTAVRGPAPIPRQVGYRVVRRVQAKSSPERLRRRLAKRKGIDAEAAFRAIPQHAMELLDLPYVTLNSRSTEQQFRLFIEQGPLLDKAVDGSFSRYGLSPTATVPWF